MSILRIYDPPECDADGIPHSWYECRTCEKTGEVPNCHEGCCWLPCPTCDGHRSLKAAALAACVSRYMGAQASTHPFADPHNFARCEACGHSMSKGKWELAPGITKTNRHDLECEIMVLPDALHQLKIGREPDSSIAVYYSQCDEGCNHDGSIRVWSEIFGGKWIYDPGGCGIFPDDAQREASWRQVDVRTIGWPHDLRSEKLALLCLRCYADRIK